MKTKILYSLLAIFIFTACSKDKFTTKPQLKFLKFNRNVYSPSDLLQITLQVTDKEGDISDTLYVERQVPNCPLGNFTTKYKVPNFTAIKDLNGELQICYSFQINGGCPVLQGPRCPNQNDTAFFRFAIKDKAGNLSDTIMTPTIVITR